MRFLLDTDVVLDFVLEREPFASPIADYEDAVQHASAAASHLEAIVTRNVGDYRNAALPIFTPSDLLEHLKQQQS